MKLEIEKFKQYFNCYTELRFQENRIIKITSQNGVITRNDRIDNGGVSARCGLNGKWGFSADSAESDDDVRAVLKEAERNADILATRTGSGMIFDDVIEEQSINKLLYTKKDKLSQQEILNFLKDIDNYILKKYPQIIGRVVNVTSKDIEKVLTTSNGSQMHTMIPCCYLYVIITASGKDGPVSLDKDFTEVGQVEDILKSPDYYYREIDKMYDHLLKKCDAVHAKAGIKDVILDASLAGILAHEAIGHTTEADCVLGGSIAGNYVGKKVGSDLVTIIDWANSYNGKTLPVPVYMDDEGVKAEDVIIIENGILKSFMHNKQTAKHFGVKPTGNARASEYFDEPLIRMRNTGFLPGHSKLEEMISSIEDGYYLVKPSNGQADTTAEFMFGISLGYEIKNGKLGRSIKDTTISGMAFDVLESVTMVSDTVEWSGFGVCGKKQGISVGMGGPAIKCKVNMGGI